jgi:hypothetical protein
VLSVTVGRVQMASPKDAQQKDVKTERKNETPH